MIDWSTCSTVERDPERVGGVWIFRGTRVPVAALFENLEDNVPIGQFVALFPGVTLNKRAPCWNMPLEARFRRRSAHPF